MRHFLAASLFVIMMIAGQGTALAQGFATHGWMTDFGKASVTLDEIVSNGQPRDGIPSIDTPVAVKVANAPHLPDKEPVLRLEMNGEVRAYPLRILIWHEIVNDTIGGVPVLITYCPLCNSAMAFKREVDGEPVEFGITGLLHKSNMVMYDRKTESWWQQFNGEAIVGKKTGTKLVMLPAVTESYELFTQSFPHGDVLVPNESNFRAYGTTPYVNYDSSDRPFPLFMGNLPEDIDPMARVVVIKDRDSQKVRAVALERLRHDKHVSFGDVDLWWAAGQVSTLDQELIADSRDIGNVIAVRQTNNRHRPVVYDITFAFVYRAFHPDGPLLQ